MIINLLLINLIISYIIDISGVMDSIKSFLKRILTKGKMSDPNYSIKPFDCSLCMTFWVSLLYVYLIGQFSIYGLFLACANSYVVQFSKDLYLLIKDIFVKVLDLIYKFISTK